MKNVKWLFFLLIGINLVYFLWGTQQNSSPIAAIENSPSNLILLSEEVDTKESSVTLPTPPKKEAVKPVIAETVKLVEAANSVKVESTGSCLRIELFTSKPIADQAVALLSADKVKASLEGVQSEVGSDFLVYLPPFESHDAALIRLRELHAQSIDSFIIASGERANGISLGIFAKEAAGKTAQLQLKAKGLDATLDEVPKIHTEYALVVNGLSVENFPAELWNSLITISKTLQKKPTVCPG